MNTRRAFLYLRALTYYSIYKVNRNSTVCISIFPLKIPCQEGKESMAMKELFKVLKDHSNRFMQELVSSSFQHCFLSEVESILEDPDSMDIQECGTENVVRVRLVHAPFRSVLSEAIAKIQHANLIIDRFGLDCNQEANSAKEKEEEPRLGDKMTVFITTSP